MSLLANDKYDTSLRGIEWKADTINVINDFQKRLLVNAQLNETIKKDLEREKVKSKIFSGIAGVAVVVTIVTILIK